LDLPHPQALTPALPKEIGTTWVRGELRSRPIRMNGRKSRVRYSLQG
jgi:hypothetical protein